MGGFGGKGQKGGMGGIGDTRLGSDVTFNTIATGKNARAKAQRAKQAKSTARSARLDADIDFRTCSKADKQSECTKRVLPGMRLPKTSGFPISDLSGSENNVFLKGV